MSSACGAAFGSFLISVCSSARMRERSGCSISFIMNTRGSRARWTAQPQADRGHEGQGRDRGEPASTL